MKNDTLTEKSGNVFSIEEFSAFDGPGIRSTVFLKGCPMRCDWCHNPEGQEQMPEIIRSPNGCISCGACISNAEKHGGKTVFTEKSISVCPRSLLRYSGTYYTVSELCEKLLKNSFFLRDGGVTFSGGEPFFQSEFLFSCLSYLKGKLHTAIQTSGMCGGNAFERSLSLCDMYLFDIKLMDEKEHISHTGASNRLILSNYETLCRSGKEFITRIPLIPGVTDTVKNITAISSFLRKNGVSYAELLPYNKMAGSKYKMLMRKYMPRFDDTIECQTHTEIFDSFGIRTKTL